MATQAPPRGRRGGPPLVLLGVALLIALAIAYLSDCIPGLGSGGGDPGTPSTPAPTTPADPAAQGSAAADRIEITVQGDRCQLGQTPAAPCPDVCASLGRSHDPAVASTLEVAVEATAGRHGTVEELRQCLRDAGFTNVRIHAD